MIILFFMFLFVCATRRPDLIFVDVHGRVLGTTIFLVVLRAILCVINRMSTHGARTWCNVECIDDFVCACVSFYFLCCRGSTRPKKVCVCVCGVFCLVVWVCWRVGVWHSLCTFPSCLCVLIRGATPGVPFAGPPLDDLTCVILCVVCAPCHVCFRCCCC